MSDFDILPKHFDAAEVEKKWRERWHASDFSDSTPQEGRENYCIMLPPPNVTGTLHMGHAFQHTLMDALARRERMRGRNVLWQPGTDHAGIATQIVVGRELAAKNIDASTLTREEFLAHAWEWKKKSEGVIAEQMRRLGASCDWKRERFTLDEGLSEAVREVFVRLYEEGLIYRGKRLVNWDPVILTAVSDLEVVSNEEDGVMYYVRYPFVENEKEGMVIGTTRPETILVDGAIAVHPDDSRYQHLVGKKVWVPMTEPRRAIEIIADEYVQPDFGSGAVKITAAHDFNDYEVRARHADKDIPLIILFTPQACMNENAPEAYRGLDRFAARKQIVIDLAAAGLLVKQEPHRYKLPRGDRSGAVVEPMLTDQWFMKMDSLAAAGLEAANKESRFVPDNWQKVYEQWLNNINDWCISRQLIWGHRIPAWHDEEGNVYVARSEEEAQKQAGDKAIKQDPDVLDTWFSSALWPFSTLDWPNKDNVHFKHYFPTSTLVTGFDIIFFWVARMIMMSKHFLDVSPFRDIYITGLVRDSSGQKMSKSKGNILDPLDLADGISCEELVQKRTGGLMNPAQADSIAATTRRHFADGIPAFGVDALRFTFASLASYGRDIKFDLSRCGGYKNFCNKIWNATRFVLGVCGDHSPNIKEEDMSPPSIADAWIVSRLQRTEKEISEAFDGYRFDLVANAIYKFLWNDYCDWYVEIAKLQLRKDEKTRRRTQRTLISSLEKALRLLHPLTPFITDELWEKIAPLVIDSPPPSIMQMPWPTAQQDKINDSAEQAMQRAIALIEKCREFRELIVPPSARPLLLVVGDATEFAALDGDIIAQLCGCSGYEMREKLPFKLPQTSASGFLMTLEWQADTKQIREQLRQKIEKVKDELSVVMKALENESFVARAPTEVVEKKRLLKNKKKSLLYELYINSGLAQYDSGNFQNAINDFNEIIKLNPEDVAVYYNRGIAQYDSGNSEDAIRDFDEVIRLNPEAHEAYNRRGMAKTKLKQYENAISDFDEAIRLNPKTYEVYTHRGIAKNSSGNFQDAISDFDEAIRLNPKSYETYNNRRFAKSALGDQKGAADDFAVANELQRNLKL